MFREVVQTMTVHWEVHFYLWPSNSLKSVEFFYTCFSLSLLSFSIMLIPVDHVKLDCSPVLSAKGIVEFPSQKLCCGLRPIKKSRIPPPDLITVTLYLPVGFPLFIFL